MAMLLDQQTKDEWAELGGWYKDPFHHLMEYWKTAEFVSAYGHQKTQMKILLSQLHGMWIILKDLDQGPCRSMSLLEIE